MKPWRVSQTRNAPRARTMATDSCRTSSMKRGSSSSPAISRARPDGSTSASSTSRPSTLETAFCATQRTSPSSSGAPWRSNASSDQAREVVAAAQLEQPVDADDAQLAHLVDRRDRGLGEPPARRDVVHEGRREHRAQAEGLDVRHEGRVRLVEHEHRRDRRHEPRDAQRTRSGPERLEHARERPLDRLPRDDRRDRHDPLARARSSASRTPSTARIGSSETNGFDGASTITSASRMASSTPGAGRAGSPSKRTVRTGSTRAAADEPLLELELAGVRPDARAQPVVGRREATGSSSPSRRTRSAVIADSGSPARRRSVRTRCRPMSRSPRMNQSAPPSSPATPCAARVSPATPHPLTGSIRPDSVYSTVSRSGDTCSPSSSTSSPTLPTIVTRRRIDRGDQTASEPRSADPAGEQRHTASVARHEARSSGVSRSCASRGRSTCRPPWRAALPGP